MTTYAYKTKPMKHQRHVLRDIIARKGVSALLCEPGTGKTKPTIDYMGMLAEAKGACLALVIAPLSALDTWDDEVAVHLPDRIEREVHVLHKGTVVEKAERLRVIAKEHRERGAGLTLIVVNHDVLSSSHRVKGTRTVTNRQRMADRIREAGFDLIVNDESHRGKGANSNLGRMLRSLSAAAPRRLILTGTVAPHSPMDFWAQWAFLNPDRFGSFAEFKDRYAIKGGHQGKVLVRFRNLGHLRREIAKDATIVKKADALDLPPVTEQVIPVHLTEPERKAYDQAKKEMLVDLGEDVGGEVRQHIVPTALVKYLRLRQLTSGHLTDGLAGTVEHFGDSKVRVCVDMLRDLASAGEKVIVFAHFTDEVRRVTKAAGKALGCPVEFIDGSVKPEERTAIRKRFKHATGAYVVVAQMRTVSLAVNEFVVASYGIFLSLSERRDDWTQAKDRLDRKGQTRPVTFYYLNVPGSIDTVLLHAHREKLALEEEVLRHLRS